MERGNQGRVRESDNDLRRWIQRGEVQRIDGVDSEDQVGGTAARHRQLRTPLIAISRLIEELRSILASPAKVLHIIKTEVLDLKKRFGDERRTEIVPEES